MSENLSSSPCFERESIITQHGIFALVVDILNKQIQVKYQSLPVSPFETHKRIMSAFFVALFTYATASVSESMLRAIDSVHHRLVANIRLFSSALATVLLLVILAPVLGCTISVLWTCLLLIVAYESCQEVAQLLCQTKTEVHDRLKKVIGTARSSKVEPNQSNV